MFRPWFEFFNIGQRSVCVHMAGAGAVPEFGNGVGRIRIFVLFMFPWSVIVGMAPCAIGLQSGVRIIYNFTIGYMTIVAAHIATVVARVERRHMAEESWFPRTG